MPIMRKLDLLALCCLTAAAHGQTRASPRRGNSVAAQLPLGITLDAEYTETSLRLAPGESFTFFSDRVVEAQSPAGELFGFERTGLISRQSAQEIADAAQAFGQEDDITVLTLQFAPA